MIRNCVLSLFTAVIAYAASAAANEPISLELNALENAESRCRVEPPALRQLGPGHRVACHLAS